MKTFKKTKLKSEYLKKVIKLSEKDSQINVNGKFDEFTDFQNVMLSNFCLLELLWDSCEEELFQKTIGELYIECLMLNKQDNFDYEKTVFTGDDWLKMADKKNWNKYRVLVLGKLVRYGFSQIKIIKKISGKDSFDSFLLEDICGNLMAYYPCTNLVEIEDFVYDSYNIINSISKSDKNFINKITPTDKIYNSQQLQAKEFLDECIKLLPEGKFISVFGFSLGGSLAESAYLSSYNEYHNVLGDIILFNPYHDNLSTDNTNKLKQTNKLKIYACEGDLVSTFFNYNDFSGVTKPIFINYLKNSEVALKNIDNNKNLLNAVVNYIKNSLCNSAISSIKKSKDNCSRFNFILKNSLGFSIKQVQKIKKSKINAINDLKSLQNIIKKIAVILKKVGLNFDIDNDFSFLKNIHYLEYIFTTPHLPYMVELYKEISFDQNGKILKLININEKYYSVNYPSFDITSTKIFGSNIYVDIVNVIAKLHKK